ncbi:kinase-like domain-containing protein [Hypoxylon sp. FL0543]|nr:kinase-like domain-containing protein [Hypoxylon sp. FL0543]
MSSPIPISSSALKTDDCNGSDTESDTSTVEWDHEPFSEFQFRVLAFAHSDVWPDTDPGHITVERLLGGGFNRIVGITRRDSDQADSIETRYILRIPRLDSSQVDRDAGVLRFLELHTSIPVPRVIKYDDTAHNGLESPYMIQDRISGTDLCSSFQFLDHATRKRVAYELGTVINQMLATRSSTTGNLAFSNELESPNASFYVIPFGYKDSRLAVPHSDSPNTESLLEQLTTNFQAQTAAALDYCPKETFRPNFMRRFCTMASELDAGGWFNSVPNCIAHFDFHPRNILVEPTEDPQKPVVSAILDWDDAGFAPMFMACAPPLWIWCWKDDEDEDERTANDDPPTLEAQELKKLFEEAAGEDYMRFAYQPAYRLARRLVRFAIDGRIRSSEDVREAEEMLQEWEAIK